MSNDVYKNYSCPEGHLLYDLEEEYNHIKDNTTLDSLFSGFIPVCADSAGYKVKHDVYGSQKSLLSTLLSDIDDISLQLSLPIRDTEDYHQFLFDYLDYVIANEGYVYSAFRDYLIQLDKTWLLINFKYGYDTKTGYAFKDLSYISSPAVQFTASYKNRKMSSILMFRSAFYLIKKYEDEGDSIKIPSSLEDAYNCICEYKNRDILPDFLLPTCLGIFKALMNKPILFLTITFGDGSTHPAETFKIYRQKWNNFFTRLKRIMKKLGWDYHWYALGLEPTKAGRLHCHIVFLGINLSHPMQLKTFKIELDKLLKSVGFGYISDTTIITDEFNLKIKSQSDFEDDIQNLSWYKVLDRFSLEYFDKDGNKKVAKMVLYKCNPPKTGEQWEKVVNYVFKYILKGKVVQDFEGDYDSEEFNNWVKTHCWFWLFGVRRWRFSRYLNTVIQCLIKILCGGRRWFFTNSLIDLLCYFENKSLPLPKGVRHFEPYVLFGDNDDHKKVIEEVLSRPTVYAFYESLKKDNPDNPFDNSDDLVFDSVSELSAEFLKSLHFRYYIEPCQLSGLICNDLFKRILHLHTAMVNLHSRVGS